MRNTYDLLLRVFIRRQQIHGLHMAKVDVMAEQEDEQQLTHIFLLLIAVERLVAFEFTSNIRQLLVHTLHFRLFAFACAMSNPSE